MPRRKPTSAKQRKTELKVKRAIKRGDLPRETAQSSPGSVNRGRGGGPRRGNQPLRANVDASRRLESSFVKFSPEFLDEAKRKASSLSVVRPIVTEKLLFPVRSERASTPGSSRARELAILRRPKWRYDMSKKEVESNEAGIFKKWLEETDQYIETWKTEVSDQGKDEETTESTDSNTELEDNTERMPFAAPLFERNLEVWRQLWRVTEICQILLVLLDSRCPPLHYPPSLNAYLSSFRPARKIIFVLTKVDISGPKRSFLWEEYLRRTYPHIRAISVENYLEKNSGEGQGKRVIKEPHIPVERRKDLVQALKEAHKELCTPPSYISDVDKLAKWKPKVVPTIDWDAVLNAEDIDVSHGDDIRPRGSTLDDQVNSESDNVEEYLSVGLIGQPNVGKSSLLNALFGSHKVKASKTPGKTKHFQTLFWTKQIKLVDCPGLVFPGYVDLEMQVLAGVLPISQLPAIPSSIYHALQYLPLETILDLQHPASKDAVEDKRTWRAGTGPITKVAERSFQWTAMDVLTAFAEKKGWITAKAGRPDVNRAGNFILRMLAEGRIKWAFYPPDTDLTILTDEDKGLGIWIEGNTEGWTVEHADSDYGSASERASSESEESDRTVSEDEEEDIISKTDPRDGISTNTGVGMFDALTLEDNASSSDGSND